MTRAHSVRERHSSGSAQQHDPHPEPLRSQRLNADAEAGTPTEREAKLFQLLAHPARLALLDALRDGAACVCHLEALLGYPQAYISQQLAVLRTAGLIEGRREGWNVYYRVCDMRLFEVLDAALGLRIPAGSTSLARPTQRESGAVVPGCACPHCAISTTAAEASDRYPTSADRQENS